MCGKPAQEPLLGWRGRGSTESNFLAQEHLWESSSLGYTSAMETDAGENLPQDVSVQGKIAELIIAGFHCLNDISIVEGGMLPH